MNVVILIFLFIANCDSAKILGIFPMAAPSHYILGNSLLKGLAEKGHDVTMISPFTENNPPKNGSYKDVVLTGFREEHLKRVKNMNMFEMGDKNLILLLPFFSKMMLDLTEQTLNHTNVQKLLKSKEKFDVVIVEQFMNEAHKALAAHYNAPLVLLSTIGANSWVNLLVGNPEPPSYVADTFLAYSSHMTFCERVKNTLMYMFRYVYTSFIDIPQQAKIAKKYFPNAPPLEDIIYNTSIVLLNSHPSTNQPVPYVPNMIDIGGYHIQPPKALPKDLKDFLDGAKDGVIYFSMGSNVRSADFPPEKRDAFLKAFSKLREKVLWKWEEDSLPGQPPNVKLAKWLPQQDVLAHPNVKLFMTHSGLLSTLETIYHGMPVLSIPLGGDQKLNAQKVVNEGFGLMLNYKDISEASLTEKLNDILTNPKYRDNAKKKSKIFHDRLVKPMDTATYWIEYVIRHGGAPHLRVAALDLPLYKYLLLDVIVFISIVSLVSLYVFFFVCKKVVGRLCRKQKQEKVKNN